MRRTPLCVFGASGHGKVVAEAAAQSGFELLGFLDDDDARWGHSFQGLPIFGGLGAVAGLPPEARVALGIGDNRARREVFLRLAAQQARLVTVVHPSASVSPSAEVGEGGYVGPLAVIHVDARIGRGCIMNSGSVVEHDAVIGDWAHVSPNAALGGGVTIGEGTHLGLGASVLPGLTIGSWATIGAGAVVIRPMPGSVTAVGVPARVVPAGRAEG